MEESAYIGSAAAGLVYFVLGTRLVRLGIRTRSAAKNLLGLTFLTWTLAYFAPAGYQRRINSSAVSA